MSKNERNEIRKTITRIIENDFKSLHLNVQISKFISKLNIFENVTIQKQLLFVNQNKLSFDLKFILNNKR